MDEITLLKVVLEKARQFVEERERPPSSENFLGRSTKAEQEKAAYTLLLGAVLRAEDVMREEE